jgi:hypothetical protein
MLAAVLSSVIAINGFVPQVSFESRPSPDQGPTLQLGLLSEPLRGDLSLSARGWALTNRERLGLHPSSTLVFDTGFATRWGASLHYLQQLNGVEVYQGKLVVTVDDRARIIQASSSVVGARAVKNLFLLDEAQAMAKAATLVPYPALRQDDSRLPYGGAKRQFFAVDDELRAGWLVHVASFDPSKNWYVAIDAATGEAIFVQNRVHHAEFNANVYPISPGALDGGVSATPTTIGSLTRADGGTFIGQSCELFLDDGGFATVDNDAGVLCGDQLTTYNCCTNQNCVPDAGPRRIAGPTSIMGFTINLDLPVCDRVNQATNQRDAGDYRYTPVDPPTNRMAVDPNDPANSDTFAHVHAFYHVNRVYDWLRGLSGRGPALFPTNQPAIGPFRMRDERRTPARKPAVLTNVIIPDFQNFAAIDGIPGCLPPPLGQGMGTCRVRGFSRIDNAAFLPVEQFAQLPIPGLSTGVDTLMIFQGNAADAAYDATVLWHEFGHGVVYATAALTFEDVALDNRSANNEGGALHEGLADYIAGAFGNTADVGPYFGPRALGASGVMGVRQDGYLRSMGNSLSCPGVLWGQVHQDSQHVSAALWQGRVQNLGTDNGATYDAAFYAMLVSIAPNATFGDVARVMAARVSTAFTPAAATALEQLFQTKGVTGCSKVLEVTDTSPARPYFGIPQARLLANAQVPGPFQFKIAVPAGASAIRIRGQQQGGGGFGGGMPPELTVLAKTQSAVTFTRAGGNLTNDAEFNGTARSMGGAIDARVDVRIPCGIQEVYVALTSRGGGAVLQNLQVTAEPLVNCMFPVPDAGVMPQPDAGMMPEPDAGTGSTETKQLPFAGTVQQPAAATGCGCASLDGASVVALLGLLGLARRRRSSNGT